MDEMLAALLAAIPECSVLTPYVRKISYLYLFIFIGQLRQKTINT